GSVSRLADEPPARCIALLLALPLICWAGSGFTQALYKYQGPDGAWVYSDRAPADDQAVEVRELASAPAAPRVKVTHQFSDGSLRLMAANDYFAPVELIL